MMAGVTNVVSANAVMRVVVGMCGESRLSDSRYGERENTSAHELLHNGVEPLPVPPAL